VTETLLENAFGYIVSNKNLQLHVGFLQNLVTNGLVVRFKYCSTLGVPCV